RVQAFRNWLFEEGAEYKRLCDELDARRAAGKSPAECAQEGGWRALRAQP
ncbi:XRE family transcriptional regulator, partial [Pseudomonas sp. MWU12-2115]